MNVIWTETAKKSYIRNIEFLLEVWNIKVVADFILEVENTMNIIKSNPKCFRKWDYDTNYHIGFIHKNVSFYYRVYSDEIVVHLFWNNFQNPKKLKKLLLK